MSKIVYLEEIFKTQDEHRRRVKETEALLAYYKGCSDDSSKQRKAFVTKIISEGGTTGDRLQDQAFLVFGLDRSKISNTLEFNKKFQRAKEVLIKMTYQVPAKNVLEQRLDYNDEYYTKTSFIYGTPSGERIELPSYNEITLPFKRYVLEGFPTNQANIPTVHDGHLTMTSVIGPPSFCSVTKIISLISETGKNQDFGTKIFFEETEESLPDFTKGREELKKVALREYFMSMDY